MDDDFLELHFDVPTPGSQFNWKERFKLDQPAKKLRAVFEDGHCVGVIDVYMKKQVQSATAPSQTTPEKAPAVAPTATEADIAWRAIKDNNDEQELRLFLKDHGESKYAETAIAALAVSSNASVRYSTGNDYDTTGRWRVAAQYEAVAGKAAYCVKPHVWEFDLTLSNTPQSYTFWTGSEDLYVNSTIKDGQLVLALNYPGGGSNWQWSEEFKLDQEQKTFLSEAQETGGGHAGCIGKIVFSMKKIGNTG